jgi:hypothetical protein
LIENALTKISGRNNDPPPDRDGGGIDTSMFRTRHPGWQEQFTSAFVKLPDRYRGGYRTARTWNH